MHKHKNERARIGISLQPIARGVHGAGCLCPDAPCLLRKPIFSLLLGTDLIDVLRIRRDVFHPSMHAANS